ncbi:hypothetical protein EON79_16990 [bacterium]|nr:MAG: hypothetical protein EON79_16990 [bacterium]
MTKAKGRLTEWIEAKVRALSAPPRVLPIEKAPPHMRVTERGARVAAPHGRARRGTDDQGHRGRRAR